MPFASVGHLRLDMQVLILLLRQELRCSSPDVLEGAIGLSGTYPSGTYLLAGWNGVDKRELDPWLQTDYLHLTFTLLSPHASFSQTLAPLALWSGAPSHQNMTESCDSNCALPLFAEPLSQYSPLCCAPFPSNLPRPALLSPSSGPPPSFLSLPVPPLIRSTLDSYSRAA